MGSKTIINVSSNVHKLIYKKVSSKVWSHLALRIWGWPWRLLYASDPRLTQPERAEIFQDFLDEPECCLDTWCSYWLRARASSLRVLESMEVQMLLRTMARQLVSTNMRVEGLLAQVCSKQIKSINSINPRKRALPNPPAPTLPHLVRPPPPTSLLPTSIHPPTQPTHQLTRQPT